jgi:flagellar biogenesis protein FliO
MNGFAKLFLVAIVLLATTSNAYAQDEAWPQMATANGAFFSQPLIATLLFTQQAEEFSVPGDIVLAQHQTPAANAGEPIASQHQPGVLDDRGNNLSFLHEADKPGEANALTGNASTLLWQLAAVMVLALMAVAFVFVKKSMHKSPAVDAGQLSVIGTVSLSHRAVVQLVAAGDSVLAVASDSSGVKSMVRIPQQFSDMLQTDPEPTEDQHV